MSNSSPDRATPPPAADSAADLDRLVQAITSLETIVAGWDESHALTVNALKYAIEDLHREALKRLIRALKDDPAAYARMRDALADQVVFGVLNFHGLLKQPLEARIRAALDEVRPFMHTHGGDVELVAVRPPDSVDIRLTGSCHGCPASSQTLSEGVEKAIRAHCPEIAHINQVSRASPEANAGGSSTVHFISPFALHLSSGWLDAGTLDEIAEGGVTERRVRDRSVIFSRQGNRVSCFDNSCAHLGMPLEMGEARDGVITCPYHGFQYLLESGECLTAPGVQLRVHAVHVNGQRVQVRIEE